MKMHVLRAFFITYVVYRCKQPVEACRLIEGHFQLTINASSQSSLHSTYFRQPVCI